MKELLKLLDMNHYAWSVYAEPTREFLRQGCTFGNAPEASNNVRNLKREAVFQIFDNSQY